MKELLSRMRAIDDKDLVIVAATVIACLSIALMDTASAKEVVQMALSGLFGAAVGRSMTPGAPIVPNSTPSPPSNGDSTHDSHDNLGKTRPTADHQKP